LGPFWHRESMGIPIPRGPIGRIRKKSFGSAMPRFWRNWPNSPGQRRPRCRDGVNSHGVGRFFYMFLEVFWICEIMMRLNYYIRFRQTCV
jgi:hypothetical protein